MEIVEGKNARIPIHDIGERKVILAYYEVDPFFKPAGA